MAISFFDSEIQNSKLFSNSYSNNLKKQTKLLAHLSQNVFENAKKEFISFVLVLGLSS